MDLFDFNRGIIFRIIIGILLIYILFARFYALEADVPTSLTNFQAPSTDPPVYTSYARNIVLHGDAQPYGPERYILFVYSLPTLLSSVLFKIAGTGRLQSNLYASLMNIIALAFFFLMLYRSRLKRFALIGTILLGVNFVFLMYNRLPFLENTALTMTVAGSYFLFSKSSRRSLFIAGLFYGVSAFFVKMLSGFILPAALIYLAIDSNYEHKDIKRTVNRSLIIISGFIFIALLWLFAVYLPNEAAVNEYLSESTTSVYGRPFLFKSILLFIETVMRYGNDNYAFPTMPVVTFALMTFFILFFAVRRRKTFLRELPPESWFFISWFVFGSLAVFPWNYRPLRYIPLFIPAIMGTIISIPAWKPPARSSKYSIFNWIVPLLVWPVFINFIITTITFFREGPGQIPPDYPLVIIISILLIIITYYLSIKGHINRFVTGGIFNRAVAAVIIISIVVNIAFFIRWLPIATFTGDTNSTDIAGIIGDKAVLTGSYSALLTQNNRLGNIPYFFGVTSELEPELFNRYPITHLAVQENEFNIIAANYPDIARHALLIHTYYIRGIAVNIFNITRGSINGDVNVNEWTDFEKAAYYFRQDQPQRSLLYMSSFKKTMPHSIAGDCLSAFLELRVGNVERFIEEFREAIDLDPANYRLYLQLADIVIQIDPKYKDLAKENWRKALYYNPGDDEIERRLSTLKRQD
jgi:hypothetical protein